MNGSLEDRIQSFVDRAVSLGLHPNPRRLAHSLWHFFRGIDLGGKRVLDIGGGRGTQSLFAAFSGAAGVVCLEPEAAGSFGEGTTAGFERAGEVFKVRDVTLVKKTFQDYDPGDQRFDLVLMHNSINHLDEDACERLHEDPAARQVYRRLFAKLSDVMEPGLVVVSDVSRENLWHRLGLVNPAARRIEWHKHQRPSLWADLFREQGFLFKELSWASPSILGGVGARFLDNRVAAWAYTSAFRLVVEKAN